MKINPCGKGGFTLTEIMIVVGIVGLLAEIAIPHYLEARHSASARLCIGNLRQIDNAKQMWALEDLRAPTSVPTPGEVAQYMGRGASDAPLLSCPLDSTRTYENSYDTLDLTAPPECRMRPLAHTLPY
ncbi:MAG TPA: prepilin-type N-terminal cleavage/methylation domain-containing protein [Verrucomicrobiae bacterium]|nr:prepilin-type N-terminal cleavage/methylation domain-containing protein [Verrucomicrobiae bacterium]